jgi:2-hydroxy-6-oxonona-2,4-dienedioate hydrolase
MRVSFIDLDGIRTRYYHQGSGFPVLLIHGLGITAESWLPNIDALGEHFAVYAPDLLGHGFTDPLDYQGGAPHPRIVNHLRKFAERLGLQRYSVVGSSFGALISALLYLDCPDRMEKLVLVGSGSAFRPADQGLGMASYRNATSALTNPTLENCRKRLANVCKDPNAISEELIIVQLTAYALPTALDAYERTARALMDVELIRPHRVVERLEQIKLPTLIITGREDVRAALKDTEDGCRRMPNAKLVIFDQCGHLPMIEYPDKFNKTVQDFLQH